MEIKRKNICFYVLENLWDINGSRWAFNNTDPKDTKDSLSSDDADIVEQIICTNSYVTVEGKYLFLLCSALKMLLERFIKVNL